MAEGLNGWLPNVIQEVEPFFSPKIEKGARSIAEINSKLEDTHFGIICLTPDNRTKPCIHSKEVLSRSS